jgi:hypothetical protein
MKCGRVDVSLNYMAMSTRLQAASPPTAHWIGCWVGPRAGMKAVTNISAPAGASVSFADITVSYQQEFETKQEHYASLSWLSSVPPGKCRSTNLIN